MKKIIIADASDEQLRTFGRNTLGLTLPPNCKIETLRAKVAAAWDKDYLLEPEAEDVPKQNGSAPVPITDAQAAPNPEKVRIHINVTEEASGDQPVQVGVNGKIMLIPRGEDVEIPYPYYEVLKHAISHKYDALPGGGINPVPREVPLYPFQVLA